MCFPISENTLNTVMLIAKSRPGINILLPTLIQTLDFSPSFQSVLKRNTL